MARGSLPKTEADADFPLSGWWVAKEVRAQRWRKVLGHFVDHELCNRSVSHLVASMDTHAGLKQADDGRISGPAGFQFAKGNRSVAAALGFGRGRRSVTIRCDPI
jgi:hypothetical protein